MKNQAGRFRSSVSAFECGLIRPLTLTIRQRAKTSERIFVSLGRPNSPSTMSAARFSMARDIEALSRLRLWLGEAIRTRLPVSDRWIFEFQLAAHEAAANVVVHSQSSDLRAKIEIELGITDESLEMEIFYEGSGFRHGRATSSAIFTAEGGFGLFIMQECTDSVQYGRTARERNFVRLTKLLPASEVAPHDRN